MAPEDDQRFGRRNVVSSNLTMKNVNKFNLILLNCAFHNISIFLLNEFRKWRRTFESAVRGGILDSVNHLLDTVREQ